MTARLLVGTPTANGVVASDHAAALLAMSRRLDAAGLDWTYRSLDGPNAGIGRDWLARDCLQGGFSHLLLLDGDVLFPPDLAERLLGRARPVVGGVCARGGPDLGRLERLLARRPFDDAWALAFDWDVELLAGAFEVTDGLAPVASLGTAALLVERGCLERLVSAGAVAYALRDERDRLHAFFRDLHEPDAPWRGDGAFAHRWRAAGGTVLADIGADVRRIATHGYGVPFSAFLDALRAPARGRPAGEAA